MIDLFKIYNSISDTIRRIFPDAVIVSWDDTEGSDARRDCFMLNVYTTDGGPGLVNYYEATLEVGITYFAPLQDSRPYLVDVLNKLQETFAREYTAGDYLLLSENHQTLFTEHELDFSFNSYIRTALDPPYKNVGAAIAEPYERYENLDELDTLEDATVTVNTNKE